MKRKTEKSSLLNKYDSSDEEDEVKGEEREEDPLSSEPKKGFPVGPVILSCMITLCEVIASNSIYPYVNFMMKWMEIPESYQGYYVGLLASSYFLAQFIGSFGWAFITQRFTRRVVLLSGMIGVCLSSLFLGFSQYYFMAVVARFLCGLFSGTSGIARTILGEVSTPETEARLFSFNGIAWGVGTILGPLLGGVLSDPCNQFGSVDKNAIICQFPFLLPNYANVVLVGFSMLCVIVAVPAQPQPKLFLINSEKNSDDSQEISLRVAQPSEIIPPPRPPTKSSLQLLRERNVWVSCVIYSLVTFSWSIFEEVFPLWTYWNAFTARELGLLQSFGGLIGITFQITTYPHLARKLGLFNTMRVGCISALFGFCAISWVVIVFPYANKITIWILAAVYIFIQFGAEILFVTSITSIANSTEEQNLDLVNYMGQGLGAVTRTIGPASGASLFAFTQTISKFPVDEHLIFYITGFLILLILILSLFPKKVVLGAH